MVTPPTSPPQPPDQQALAALALAAKNGSIAAEQTLYNIKKGNTGSDIKALNHDKPNTANYQRQEAKVGNDLAHLFHFQDEPNALEDVTADVNSIKNKGPFLKQVETVLINLSQFKNNLENPEALKTLHQSMKTLKGMCDDPQYQENPKDPTPMRKLAETLIKTYWKE